MEYWMVNTWLEKGETYLTSWHLPRHMQIYRCPWDGKNVPHLHFLTSFTVQCPSVPCLSGIYAQLEIRGALYDFCNMYCNTIGNWICDLDIPTLFFQVKKNVVVDIRSLGNLNKIGSKLLCCGLDCSQENHPLVGTWVIHRLLVWWNCP